MNHSDLHVRPDLELVVPEGLARRLDLFLTSAVAGLSRRQARALINAGAVRVNERRARKGQPVLPGDHIRIAAARTTGKLIAEPDLSVRILYDDEAVIAVDKPAGMPTHARHLDDRGTLANFLAARFSETQTASPNPLETGVVHRLDTGTSGVVLAARSRTSYHALRQQFSARAARKDYLAIVAGSVRRSGIVNAPVAHLPHRPRRMRVCPNVESARALRAREAITMYRPVERLGSATLLAIRIRTGVRHQIRVHLASIGHPVLGDSLYGRQIDQPLSSTRLFLHARGLRVQHPERPQVLAVVAPVPADFQSVLDLLGRSAEI